jgi:hypothetical protein
MALLSREEIESTIKSLRKREFTVLDFADALRHRHPELWTTLVGRFGEFGEKRRYTVSTYLSNRLEEYSRAGDGLLEPHPHYGEGRQRGHRRPSAEERARFGSPWIAVYRRNRPRKK